MALGDAGYVKYGQSQVSGDIVAIPRNKYSFTASMIYQGSQQPLDLTRIVNIQMPTFAYRTQTLNKYNSKSIVQTGIDYTPITLTAYDTKDHLIEDFLKDYARHYIAGPMNEDDHITWLTSKKGLETPLQKNFITQLDIIRKDSSTLENKIQIYHPYITNIDTDTLDYSDSAAAIYRITFAYEGFSIASTGTPVKPTPEPIVEEFDTADQNLFLDDFDEAEKEYLVSETKKTPPAAGNTTSGTTAIKTNKPELERWDGTLKKGEKIRNIDGVSYKVPAPIEKGAG